MESFLGTVTQHAMNYAIRSGIGITASYAIRQSSRLLKTVDNKADYQDLHSLQERLDTKIRIISPAIDMIELISARGNTTLESAVTLTKALRWDIQALGIRLSEAASAEESSRRSSKAKSRKTHEMEIRAIAEDIRRLLTRIEDAVPLINLAITTSGARLSMTLPATVSPSRLLQASAFVVAGDTKYAMNPNGPVQVGPTFTLSLYMLFTGHAHRLNDDNDSVRALTWKEVIHKARVKLIRIALNSTDQDSSNTGENSRPSAFKEVPMMAGDERGTEFAYQLQIIEDLDDDRVHSFEEDESQPQLYGDVQLAGIREVVPIHQVSKIFYANTGKILNIVNQDESSCPVLLLKRDINAPPPRRMMPESDRGDESPDDSEEALSAGQGDDNSQDGIDRQIHRESLLAEVDESGRDHTPDAERVWRLPLDLDPEWLAFEVYTEANDSSSEDDHEPSPKASPQLSSSREKSVDTDVAARLANLNLNQQSSPLATRSVFEPPTTLGSSLPPMASPFGLIRSSLSLLEMLIRLTALQQFQQASHLSIPDELLTFFLQESSTTGAGGDDKERRRTRHEARRKVGFDPYDESPMKRRGEDYQYQGQGREEYAEYPRDGTPYDDYDQREDYIPASPRWLRERSMTPDRMSEPWLRRGGDTSGSSLPGMSDIAPSSPSSPYRPPRKATRPLERVQQMHRGVKPGSPLGPGMSAETDSSLGTSPGSPSLLNRHEKSQSD